MIRMTLLSLVGHAVGFCALLFLSWYQPLPKVMRADIQRVRTFPPGSGPGAGGARPQTPGAAVVKTPPPATPKPSTPEPVKTIAAKKTIERQPKKSPTPEATKTPTPTKKAKTPKATATPAKTAKASPAPTKAPTATEAAKTPSAPPKTTPGSATPPKATSTPGGSASTTPSPMVIGGTKQGTAGTVPGLPGGTGSPGTPLSNFEYYRYMTQVKIEQNFTVPRYLRAAGITCLMKFTVLRDGRITNIRMVQGTNDAILDGFAQRALETTEQLGPLPDTIKEDSIELTVLFDYSLPEETAPRG